MQATIHAVLLISLAAFALLALFLLKRRTPTSRQFVIALSIAAVGIAAASALNHHLCREGEPRTQWLILGPCLLLILVSVNSATWRRVLSSAMFIGMIGLSCHFTELVHTPSWTGNPNWDGYGSIALRSLHVALDTAAGDLEDPQVVYPAGWLRDLAVWESIDDLFGDGYQPTVKRRIERAWHSRLTGLYHYTPVRQDYWYPGGPFAETGPKTELRDRPLP